MLVFGNEKAAKTEVKPIYLDDLHYYARQLLAFVTTYRDHIFLKTDEDVARLNELESYAVQLLNSQYDNLIMNAKEIIQLGFTPMYDYNDTIHNPPWK